MALNEPYENRLTGMVENLTGIEDADDLMVDIIDKLSDSVTPVPDLGNWYTLSTKQRLLTLHTILILWLL